MKFLEFWIFVSTVADLNLVGLEIARGDCLQNCDGCLKCLLAIPIAIILLELLFELTHCFLFFAASRDGLEANTLTRWINSEALWSELLVAAHNCSHCAKWSDTGILCIFLEVLTHSCCEDLDRYFVLVLEFVFSGHTSEILDDKSGIVHVTHNNHANIFGDGEYVSD